jgi:hypothetical protein
VKTSILGEGTASLEDAAKQNLGSIDTKPKSYEVQGSTRKDPASPSIQSQSIAGSRQKETSTPSPQPQVISAVQRGQDVERGSWTPPDVNVVVKNQIPKEETKTDVQRRSTRATLSEIPSNVGDMGVGLVNSGYM